MSARPEDTRPRPFSARLRLKLKILALMPRPNITGWSDIFLVKMVKLIPAFHWISFWDM